MEGFGAGHVAPEWVASLEELAGRCPVVLCSRTRRGELLRSTYGFCWLEEDLLRRGLIHRGALDVAKAAALLRLLLAGGAAADGVENAYSASRR